VYDYSLNSYQQRMYTIHDYIYSVSLQDLFSDLSSFNNILNFNLDISLRHPHRSRERIRSVFVEWVGRSFEYTTVQLRSVVVYPEFDLQMYMYMFVYIYIYTIIHLNYNIGFCVRTHIKMKTGSGAGWGVTRKEEII